MRKKAKKHQNGKCPPRTGLELPRSLKSARWRFRGPPRGDPFFGGGGGENGRPLSDEGGGIWGFYFFKDQRGELLRYRAYRGCYSPHGCGEAGKRLGSLCAIEVEGLKP